MSRGRRAQDHAAAGTMVDEPDEPALDHEERRVADALLVEHVARCVPAPLATLGQPPELLVREARLHDLVVEVGERLRENG